MSDRPAIRTNRRDPLARMSDRFAVRTGQFGAPREPPTRKDAQPVQVPIAPTPPAQVPLAGTATVAGRVVITSDLNAGLVTATIEPTAPSSPNPSPLNL